MKPQYFQAILFVAIILVATVLLPRPKPLTIILPEGHRAYEWEVALKITGNYRVGLTEKISEVLSGIEEKIRGQFQKYLSKEVDEKGQPIRIIDAPKVVDTHFKTRQHRDWTYITEVTTTAKTRFHGSFTEGSIALAVTLIIVKLGPIILLGIIAIIALDKIVKIAEVIRDITTDYVHEEEYLVDDEGNLVLDDEGNPIVIKMYESRTSHVTEWMPWLFNIVLVIAAAIVVAFVAPSLLGSKRRK